MKYLFIPVFLFFLVLVSGCATQQPKHNTEVKVVPQEPVKPAEPVRQEVQAPTPTAAPEAAVEAAPVSEPPAEPAAIEPEGEQQVHTVGIFETLWGISEKYYGDGSYWERILEANQDQINGPMDLRPKMELIIPPLTEE